MYALFSPETRTGRFLRGLLRTLALIVGMFALGLLAGYLLLYRPTIQQLNGARVQATQTAGNLQKTRQDLATAQQDLQTAKSQVGDIQTKLDVEVARGQVLRAMNAVTLAQMAVMSNDKAAAVKNLDTAQGYMQAVQPVLEKRDAQQASTLQALFTLTKNDLDRDLKLAAQDMDRLQSELDRAENNILK
jgi:chromosome segregation ATPase